MGSSVASFLVFGGGGGGCTDRKNVTYIRERAPQKHHSQNTVCIHNINAVPFYDMALYIRQYNDKTLLIEKHL